MSYTSEDLTRFRSYERVHLRGVNEKAATSHKVEALRKKDRNKRFMLFFNILAVIFFTWSYFFDLTDISDTIYYILLVVFSINVALILLQKRQIKELMEFYRYGAAG